jgi:hypothetical protein
MLIRTKRTLLLAIMGTLIYALGAFSIAYFFLAEPVDMNDVFSCLVISDWDPIDGPRFHADEFRWTADGKYFSFSVTRHAYWPCFVKETYLVTRDGKEITVLSDEGAFAWFQREPAWSSRQRPMAGAGWAPCEGTPPPTATPSLIPTPLPVGTPTEVWIESGMDPGLLGVSRGVSLQAWSPGKCYALFQQEADGQFHLRIMEVNSREVRTIMARRGMFNGVTWSPDGRTFVFSVGGDEGGVFIGWADKENVQQLMRGSMRMDPVRWISAQKLLFSVHGQAEGIFLVDTKAGKAKALARGGYSPGLYPSPGERRWVALKKDFWFADQFAVAVIDLDAEKGTELPVRGLLEELEEKARDKCMPRECRVFFAFGPIPYLRIKDMVPFGLLTTLTGLILVMPGLWVRKRNRWARVGLLVVSVQLLISLALIWAVLL